MKATINELSQYLEVSRRTVCRDIDMLQTSGVEIISRKGKTGGYMLSENFSFDQIIFQKSELCTMLLSTQLLQQFKDTEFAKEASALNRKIEKLLYPADHPDSQINEFLLIDTVNEDRQSNINDILRCTEKAYAGNLLLYVAYRHPFCNKLSTSGFVAPYGLVNRSGVWYIIGFCHELNGYRIFHTQFITQLYLTERAFHKDKDFHPDMFWKEKNNSVF